MSRTARQIAESGLGDLHRVQEVFSNVHTLLLLIKEKLPTGDLASDIAELGIAVINDNSEIVWQWAECMDNEIDDLPAESEADKEVGL